MYHDVPNSLYIILHEWYVRMYVLPASHWGNATWVAFCDNEVNKSWPERQKAANVWSWECSASYDESVAMIQLLHCLAATFCSQPVHLNRWYGNLRQEFCNESIHLQPAILWFHRCSEVIYFQSSLWHGKGRIFFLAAAMCFFFMFWQASFSRPILGWVWLVWLWVICI